MLVDIQTLVNRIAAEMQTTPTQRDGQAVFNVFRDMYPNLAKDLMKLDDIDPFYVDENLSRFWKWLAEINK
jgi:hypothetical protein